MVKRKSDSTKRELSKSPKKAKLSPTSEGYSEVLLAVVDLLDRARRLAGRTVNALMTATYWEIGRRIVEVEQVGADRAGYGTELIQRLSEDLTSRFGRGFSKRNLEQMRLFYQLWPKAQTMSAQSEVASNPQTGIRGSLPVTSPNLQIPAPQAHDSDSQGSGEFQFFAAAFPLSWSHYVQLLSLRDDPARRFYEAEAMRCGWSVRQLKRQIDSQFFERSLLSKNKSRMLRKSEQAKGEDFVSAEEEIRDPFVLEFLDLKDDYSESDLEEALIGKLEEFLLELGGDFAFVGRQKRLRIGDEWYRIDLLFYHRRLRCLVVIDLKIGKFTHADAGQMHMYLNYAAEHWTHADENPPVGLILCARHDESLAKYALDNLPTKVLAREYKLALPDEQLLIDELERTQRAIEARRTNSNERRMGRS